MRHSVRSVIATAILTTSLSPLVARATTPPPQCVVSLSPTATETLFAIGAGSQVKAVDRDSNFPAGRLPATRIDALNPSVEAVAGVCPRRQGVTAKPDLVIVAYDTNNIVTNLRASSASGRSHPIGFFAGSRWRPSFGVSADATGGGGGAGSFSRNFDWA